MPSFLQLPDAMLICKTPPGRSKAFIGPVMSWVSGRMDRYLVNIMIPEHARYAVRGLEAANDATALQL